MRRTTSVIPNAIWLNTKLADASPRPLPDDSSMAYDMPEASAKVIWNMRKLRRKSDTRGLSSLVLMADLKELGSIKFGLK